MVVTVKIACFGDVTCSLVDKSRRRGGSCIQLQDSNLPDCAASHVRREYARTKLNGQQI